MAVVTDPIRIDGLREFLRSLRELDGELPKAVRLAFNTAAEVIVEAARPRVPQRTGRARKSVRARSTRTEARVIGGGKRVPYYPWLDFGGKVGRGLSIDRPFIKEGRYIYASYYEHKDEFLQVMIDALIEVARQAGVEVTDHG